MNRGIDHLVLMVRDLEAAAARYRAMGFTITPKAQHAWGTANALAQLQGNFLELLTVDRPHLIVEAESGHFSFGTANRDFLAKREGCSMLVFESQDARADVRDFVGQSLTTYEPFDFQRQARLPDGSEVTVGFSLAFVTDPRMPQVTLFCCQQQAPQHFWKPDYQVHPNTAIRCEEVLLVAEDPHDLGDTFEAIQGKGSASLLAQGLKILTARGHVTLLTPEGFEQRFPGVLPKRRMGEPAATPLLRGYGIAVADLAACEAALDKGGVPFRRYAGRLQVLPGDAFGCAIEFTQSEEG